MTDGRAYRVKAEHPRRPGQRLDVWNKAGRLIASSGQTCENASAEELASMLANGYIEPLEVAPRPRRAATADDTKGGE